MLQQRVPDPTGSNARGVWTSPIRDIAHCMPNILRTAIEVTQQAVAAEHGDDSDAMRELGDLAKALAAFVNNCTGPQAPATQAELVRASALLDVPVHTQQVFGKWLLRVMLGFYFSAVKEALHPGERPLGIDALLSTPLLMTSDANGLVSDNTSKDPVASE